MEISFWIVLLVLLLWSVQGISRLFRRDLFDTGLPGSTWLAIEVMLFFILILLGLLKG